MKKLVFVWMLCACIGFGMTAQASGTLFNAYLPKAILSEEEAAQEKIQMKPDMLKVVRQSVIPWDDEGTKWSVFIEVENESESKIVLDETWLIACDGEKEEFARWYVPAIGGAFYSTVRVIQPFCRFQMQLSVFDPRLRIRDLIQMSPRLRINPRLQPHPQELCPPNLSRKFA